ncbi:MAG: glycosyltransferase family 2 protein [Roseivivax sp.]|nr:glycosyltransferase family 2 protein [Roseivivax sp.]
MTRVCVIIPAYNAVATLARTMVSAMAQTHRDLEIFVVDDGSTDRTYDLAHEVADGDLRVTILRQDNAGVAAARNLALARTRCTVTTWLDADDLWHPAKIERQLAVLNAAKEPPSFVYTGYRLIDSDDRVIPNFRTLADVSGHTLCRQTATNFFSNISSIMIPTDLARRFGGHDPRLREWGIQGAEDLLLQLQLSTIGPAACCREALVGYRMHEQNMSLGYARAARSNIRALDLIAALEPRIPDWVMKLGRARTAGYALHMLRDGDILGALRLLAELSLRQPGYTALTLLLTLKWQLHDVKVARDLADPDVGKLFAHADPLSAPWHGHMILSRRHDKALDQADRQLAAGIPHKACCQPQTS